MADKISNNGAETLAASDRQQSVESLYVNNLGFIRELIYSDPKMNTDAENQIIEGIAKHLSSYSGPTTDTSFQSWLTEIVAPIVGFHAIRRVCEPFVRAAIWRGLGHSAEPSKFDDYPETVRELEQEVWLWTFLNLEKLKKPGTAKITTRLYERATIMTKDWLKRQRTRRFAVIRRVYKLPSKTKMKAAAEQLAAELDREEQEKSEARVEAKEIQIEMKKLELMA